MQMQLVAIKISVEIVCMSKITILYSLHHLIAGHIQAVMTLGVNHGCGLHTPAVDIFRKTPMQQWWLQPLRLGWKMRNKFTDDCLPTARAWCRNSGLHHFNCRTQLRLNCQSWWCYNIYCWAMWAKTSLKYNMTFHSIQSIKNLLVHLFAIKYV